MYWHCDICDKVIYEEFRSNHLQPGFHIRLSNSINRKNVITNPEPNKIDDIIGKHSRLHYKKYEKFQAILSMKLLMTSNEISYFRRRQECPQNGWVIESSSSFFFLSK